MKPCIRIPVSWEVDLVGVNFVRVDLMGGHKENLPVIILKHFQTVIAAHHFCKYFYD
jgi:hypothetical protein